MKQTLLFVLTLSFAGIAGAADKKSCTYQFADDPEQIIADKGCHPRKMYQRCADGEWTDDVKCEPTLSKGKALPQGGSMPYIPGPKPRRGGL